MKIKTKSLVLLTLSFGISTSLFAESSYEQEVQQSCAKVKSYAQTGKKYYDQKNYAQAVKQFENQAAWTQFCQANADESRTAFTDRDVELANNNAGLAYAKMGKPLWARAWYLRTPDSKTSQYNLKQLKIPRKTSNLQGTYVSPAGSGQWNTIKVTRAAKDYQVQFNGFYYGPRGLIYGPNMGKFTTHMPLNRKQAAYQYKDCKINLNFTTHPQYGQQITVQQNDNKSGCGFGGNVYAGGTFYKVES